MATRRDQQFRGLEADRISLGGTFRTGELAYTTDAKKVWAGDGSTAGGRLVGPPVEIVLVSASGVTLSGATAVPWDQENIKEAGFTHSTSTNNHEVTCDYAGRYIIESLANVDSNGAGKYRSNWQADQGAGYIAVSILSYGNTHDSTVDFCALTFPAIVVDLAAGAKLKQICQFVAGGATTHAIPANGACVRICRIW